MEYFGKMKKLFITSFSFFIAFCFWQKVFSSSVFASQIAGNSAVFLSEAKAFPEDLRVKQLEKFLDYYQSPLAPQAKIFVEMADKYSIDWRLLPAISGVESTFGKRFPKNSYNAFGWGNGLIRFNSWEESIETISRSLKEKYYQRGLNTPYKIAPVYCPPNPSWGWKVDYFMKKIDQFETQVWLETAPLVI